MAKIKCEICGKSIDKRAKASHMRWKHGAAKNPPEVRVEAEPEQPKEAPKIETIPEPKQETIEIKQELSEVPKLDMPAMPEAETAKSEIQQVPNEEQIDFDGIDDIAVSIINSHFKKNGIPEWDEVEKARLKRYTKRMTEKYMNVYFKYALEINFGMALIVPFASRLGAILEARERNKKAEKAEPQEQQAQIQAPAKKPMTEQERAMAEYQALKSD